MPTGGRGRGRGRVGGGAGGAGGEGDAAENNEKKRGAGKKKFSVVAVVTHDSIEGTLQPEIRKPLIAHLPISSHNVVFHDAPIRYNPMPPCSVEPYDAMADNPFAEGAETVLPVDAIVAQAQPPPVQSREPAPTPSAEAVAAAAAPDFTKKTTTLLVQYEGSQETRRLPKQVDAACFWCCHTFETPPVILPIRDQGEYIQVMGNYCSPECAMAYLFDMRQDSYARWEQLSLLNRLYADATQIRPAPPRAALKLFGGPMSIEEYRAFVRKGKLRVDVHIPPLVSLLSTMDTKPIDFYDTSLTMNVMETVQERLAKAEEVLKLKRTKPLKAWESTLDACINLRVRTAT
jgi:hypothetical protein